jgi:hypothetical protein
LNLFLFFYAKHSSFPQDVVKTQEGVLNLATLNDYVGFSSAKITIFW